MLRCTLVVFLAACSDNLVADLGSTDAKTWEFQELDSFDISAGVASTLQWTDIEFTSNKDRGTTGTVVLTMLDLTHDDAVMQEEGTYASSALNALTLTFPNYVDTWVLGRTADNWMVVDVTTQRPYVFTETGASAQAFHTEIMN